MSDYRIYKAAELQDRSWLDKPGFLIEPYVPAKAKVVLLHGPGGVGKSAVLWTMQNALEEGTNFLGFPVKQTKTFLISTDMNEYELDLRWGDKFKPLFDAVVTPPFDCTRSNFVQTSLYKEVKTYVLKHNVACVFIDTLGKIHAKDPNQEETVAMVYSALLTWFPKTTIIGTFHNRKSRIDQQGHEVQSEEDFRGSSKWKDDAVVQLQLRRKGGAAYRSVLSHLKSQVSAKQEPLDLYIDVHGKVERWSDARASEVIKRWSGLVTAHPGAQPRVLIQAYCDTYHVTERQAQRVKAMYLESLKKQAKMSREVLEG